MGSDREDNARPDSIGADSLPGARRDAVDLNNEIAGRDTGRRNRFLPSDSDTRHAERKREEERKLSALMRLMQDPEYAKLYNKVQDAVSRAEQAAAITLEKLMHEHEAATQRLQSIRDSAAELPDGTKVYRSEKDGRLYTEDGKDVTAQSDSVIGLTANSPTRETATAARDAVHDIERQKQEIENYQRNTLDPAKERLADKDNPAKTDELNDIFGSVRNDMPASMKPTFESTRGVNADAAIPSRQSAAEEYLGSANLKTRELQIDFVTARDGPLAETPAAPSAAPAPKTP